MGNMSRDRIKLFIPQHRCESIQYRQVLEAAFGISYLTKFKFGYEPKYSTKGMYFICRPSQFARFVVLRNEAGLDNWIKEMHPEIVPEGYTIAPSFMELTADAANTSVPVVERVLRAAGVAGLIVGTSEPVQHEYQVWSNKNTVPCG